MTSNTKCVGHYLRSLTITAVVTFALPLILLGGAFLLLMGLQVLLPNLALMPNLAYQLQTFLAILGSGDVRQGILLIATVSCLVGMLFDTYVFYR